MAIRPALCATAFAAALAACGSDSGGEGESGTATGSPSPAQAVASATANPDDDALRAFQADWPRTDFSQRTVSLNEVFQGCPGADCIPALDAEGDGVVSIAAPRGGHARFTTIDDVDYEAQLPVAAVEHHGEARAYPLHILTFHEIVNDVLGGDPVAVTFCPLCNTAISFRREVGGDVLDFSVSGLLRNSDLVMYDRQTESWWQQATGEGIAGTHAGTQLEFVSTRILSWGDFAARFPDGTVLTEDTGFFSGYGRNPYVSYDSSSRPFLFSGEIDSRLPALERVVALDAGDEAVAVAFSTLREVGVANLEVGGAPLVVFWAPGTVSALDSSTIANSRDVGTGVAYSAATDGTVFTFRAGAESGMFEDLETGSTWDITGLAIAGSLEGTSLEVARHANHFWFAFAAFYPGTEIWQPPL